MSSYSPISQPVSQTVPTPQNSIPISITQAEAIDPNFDPISSLEYLYPLTFNSLPTSPHIYLGTHKFATIHLHKPTGAIFLKINYSFL